MKTKKILLTMLCLMVITSAWAYDFEVNGIFYNIIPGTNEVEVVSSIYGYYSGDIVIPSSVIYADVSYAVTKIGAIAFEGCIGLTSVEIPGTVKNISDFALSDCSNLTSISISDGVEYIGSNAFYNCIGLTSIEIPGSIKEIEVFAFLGCSGLKSVKVEWNIPIDIAAIFEDTIYTSCQLIVPEGTQTLYRTSSDWRKFKMVVGEHYVFSFTNAFSVATKSGNEDINILSNIPWTVSSNADWITFSPESGNGDGNVTVSYLTNENTAPRSAEIVVSGENAEDFIIQVTQFAGYTNGWEYVSTMNVTNADFSSKVYAQGSNNVYVIGAKGLIIKSEDNGLTWNKQYFPTEAALNDIAFCNDEVGFIVGNNGTILKTGDAGKNWRQIPIDRNQNINAIATTGLDNIWIVGDNGLTMGSSDAGETWVSRYYTNNRNFYDIQFRGDIGYIVGDRNNAYKTVNGGKGWNTQITYDNPDEYDQMSSLCLTENKAFMFVTNRGIMSTSNYQNWSILNTDRMRIKSFYFNDDNHGFIAYYDWTTCGCGFGLWMYETTDAGNTWEEISPMLSSYRGGIGQESNFSFSEGNEFGYFLNAELLLRTPYTGEFFIDPGEGINEIKLEDSNITLNRQENELQVSSSSKTISSVAIISMTGTTLYQKAGQNVNVSRFPKGSYLIRATFTDEMSKIVKWIKQ